MINNKSKDFWKCINQGKGNSSQAQVPECIDGTYGEDVCNVFKDKYSKLYQTDDKDSLTDIMIENNYNLNKCILNDDNCKHLHSTNLDSIKKAVCKLKNDKRESQSILTSNAIKNGTDMLFLYISFLFTIMIRHGYSNDIFNTVIFNPIVKDARKSKNDSNNYRALALNSLFSKLLDYIILDYFILELSSSQFQFAYKSDFSTTLCSFILKETVEYYNSNGNSVYATFLDCSKAFDLVKHDILFRILIDKGICSLIVRLLLKMYSNMKGKVRWKNYFSDFFQVFNGIKQGGVISPILFSLYIDKLIDIVHSSNFGCSIGDVPSSILIYADDIVLLSPKRYGMKTMSNLCETFGTDTGLRFNPDKCECLIFGNTVFLNNRPISEFNLNGKLTKFVQSTKHLGHEFTSGKCSFFF